MDSGSFETIEKFMARALHDPVRGYYARNIRSIGARGDFTTAPQLSEAPAKAIAAWIARALRETKTRHVIEIGPGLGTLTAQVIRRLPFAIRFRSRFHLVESSPALAEHQKALFGNKVSHHTSILDALQSCAGEAVIFSNELVDAFPARVFRKNCGSWREVALDGSSQEILLPPAELPPSSIFPIQFKENQTVEVHDAYRLWLESWLPSWERGEMLTIDYGDDAEKIYHQRPQGTLRAYLLHQRLHGSAVFENCGLQDITADVNFTDLAAWSDPWLASSPSASFVDFIRTFADSSDEQFLGAAAHFRILFQKPARRL
jgi:SAM-dependent MidA family methyltransferase